MSNSQTPQDSSAFKRQLPFSAMKPPFLAPGGDYHRFAAEPHRRLDQEAEAIVVKSPVSFLFSSCFYFLIFCFCLCFTFLGFCVT